MKSPEVTWSYLELLEVTCIYLNSPKVTWNVFESLEFSWNLLKLAKYSEVNVDLIFFSNVRCGKCDVAHLDEPDPKK